MQSPRIPLLPQTAVSVFALIVTLTYCGAAQVKGQDCPDPAQLQSGVRLLCGNREIVGTLPAAGVAKCESEGQLDCVTSDAFKPVAKTALDPVNIKAGVTIGGVVGTYAGDGEPATGGGGLTCSFDGQQDCVAAGNFVAADLTGLAERIAAGEIVGGVSGVAVLNPAASCTSNGQVGCLAVTAYPAVEGSRLAQCLGVTP